MNRKQRKAMELVSLVISGIIIAAIILSALNSANKGGKCMDYGYPDWKYGGVKVYCVKLENNTSIVVPLAELEDRQ